MRLRTCGSFLVNYSPVYFHRELDALADKSDYGYPRQSSSGTSVSLSGRGGVVLEICSALFLFISLGVSSCRKQRSRMDDIQR